ncbi:MAG: hypothetical protein ACLFP8_02810 [Alphaproteobacteria bacterium]
MFNISAIRSFLLRDNPLSYWRRRVLHGYKGASCFCEYLCHAERYRSEETVRENFDSLVQDVYEWLDDKQYHMARESLNLMLDHADGKTRDDEITPGPLHEITQAVWFISAIEDGFTVRDPEIILSLIFVHDLGEDYNIKPQTLEARLRERGISSDSRVRALLKSFDVITKYYGKDERVQYHLGRGRYKTEGDYQNGVSVDKYASVAKMFDRMHNLMTLVSVREIKQMHEEIAKTARYYVLNRIRRMSKDFPEHEAIYDLMYKALVTQLEFSRYYTVPDGDPLPDNEEILSQMPKKGFPYMPEGLHPLLVIARRTRAEYPEIYGQSARPDPLAAHNSMG